MTTCKPLSHHRGIARDILAAPNAEDHLTKMVAHIIRAIDTRDDPKAHNEQLIELFLLLGSSE